jgi:hypothetical protein
MNPRQLLESLRVVSQDLQVRIAVVERAIVALRQSFNLEQQKTAVMKQEIAVLQQKLNETEDQGGEVGPVSGW